MSPELVAVLGLHIVGLVAWCAALLYLPALIVAGPALRGALCWRADMPPARAVFTMAATPAALLAIVTGSLLVLLERTFGVWLVFKLTAVAGMVAAHVFLGLLILRQEDNPHAVLVRPCITVALASVALIATVLWLVLAKPY